MDIKNLDLNLLRVFDAVYRHCSVSRAAEELGMSQPAASQAVTRLRLLLGNPLFERAHAGVRPTPRAERLALAVRQALEVLEVAMSEAQSFEPLQARQRFRIHLSDIGEARFLPPLMQALHQRAPHVQLETLPMPLDGIADALDRGTLDIAIGFLPGGTRTRQTVLLSDHYGVLLRSGHPRWRTCPKTRHWRWPRCASWISRRCARIRRRCASCRRCGSMSASACRQHTSWPCPPSWARPTWR